MTFSLQIYCFSGRNYSTQLTLVVLFECRATAKLYSDWQYCLGPVSSLTLTYALQAFTKSVVTLTLRTTKYSFYLCERPLKRTKPITIGSTYNNQFAI